MGPGQRLKLAIRLAGYGKITTFAKACGLNPVTVRAHIQRDVIPAPMAARYLRQLVGLEVTADWLLYGKGPPPHEPGQRDVASRDVPDLVAQHTPAVESARGLSPDLLGEVITNISGRVALVGDVLGAGEVRFLDEQPTREFLRAMQQGRQTGVPLTGGLIVETEILRPRYSAGDMLLFLAQRREHDWHREVGRECIVQIHNGPTVLRVVRYAGTPDRATLTSWTAPDIDNARIDWVVPVLLARREARPRPHLAGHRPPLAIDHAIESLTSVRSTLYLDPREVRALALAPPAAQRKH